jgi:dihydrofolate reductase
MSFSIIAAIDQNNVIGNNNKLLWHIPEDLKFFKETTTGHTIIMGRKTFESIGRPLPNRKNVVITRNKEWDHAGVEVYTSMSDINPSTTDEELFIIGGGEIYKEALPLASKLYITHVHASFSGDTYFPTIDTSVWKKESERHVPANDVNPFDVTFTTYVR